MRAEGALGGTTRCWWLGSTPGSGYRNESVFRASGPFVKGTASTRASRSASGASRPPESCRASRLAS